MESTRSHFLEEEALVVQKHGLCYSRQQSPDLGVESYRWSTEGLGLGGGWVEGIAWELSKEDLKS